MKVTYFFFFVLLFASMKAISLKKHSCPVTTTTTTPATSATTAPTTTTTAATTPATTTAATTPATNTTATTSTTTTTAPATTTTLPSNFRVNGVWVLTEDNTVPTPAGWYPKVRAGNPFNTYFLSFLNPNTMFTNGQVAKPSFAFTQFSSTRDVAGSPKSSDKVIYSIGGYSYSQSGQLWPMFDSNANAILFAQAVVSWKQLYKMDGFDLDWEAASWYLTSTQVQAIYTFISTLKTLDPTLILTVEEGGYPQFAGATVIQWANTNGKLTNLMSYVNYWNVMFYSTDPTQNSLYWAQSSWQKDCSSWCALGTKIPSNKILLGVPGCCDQASTQATLKSELCATGPDGLQYGGYHTWYISSDSTPNIAYGGVCSGSLGCQMNPANAATYFALPKC